MSTKEHDTLKKPRELLAVAYSIRYPELAAKSKNPNGEVDIDTMDPAVRVPVAQMRIVRDETGTYRWWKAIDSIFWQSSDSS